MEGDNVYLHDGRRTCMACRSMQFTLNGAQKRFKLAPESADAPTLKNEGVPLPTKTHCKNGHAMEGDNLYMKPDGTGFGCAACHLAAVKRYQANNREGYLSRRKELRREKIDAQKAVSNASDEALKTRIVALYAENLPDDELIRRLREVIPPPTV